MMAILWLSTLLVPLAVPPAGEEPDRGERPKPSGGESSGKDPQPGGKGSLLKNGGFEGGVHPFTGNWVAAAPSAAGVKVGVDEADPFEGEQSGALQNYNPKVDSPLTFSQTIDAATVAKWVGRELTLAAAIRTENASLADVRIEGYDSRGRPLDALSVTGGGVQGTNGWKCSKAHLLVPAGASTLVVRCVLEGTGTAWFDKVELLPVPLEESKAASGMIDQIRDLLGRYLRAPGNSKAEREAKEALQGAAHEALVAAVSKGILYGKLPWGGSREESFEGPSSWPYRISLPLKELEEGKTAPLLLDLSPPKGQGEPWVALPGASSWFVARALSRLTPGTKLSQGIVEWVRDISRKHPVDRGRVFVVGWKESAAAAGAAALSHPGEFAGAILVHPAELPPPDLSGNAGGLSLFIASKGGEQSAVGAAAGFWRTRKGAVTLRDLDPSRDPYVAIGEEILRWCEGKSRPGDDPFEEVLTSAETRGSYWAEVLQFTASRAEESGGRIMVKILSANQIELETSGVKTLRLLIAPKRFDLGRPLRVQVGKEPRFQGPIQTDPDTFLVDLKRRGVDSARIPAGWVVLDL